MPAFRKLCWPRCRIPRLRRDEEARHPGARTSSSAAISKRYWSSTFFARLPTRTSLRTRTSAFHYCVVKGFVAAFTRNTRWLTWVGLVFTIQIGIIVWFSERGKPAVKKPAPAPMLSLAGRGSSELLALRDPTLFALPHYR